MSIEKTLKMPPEVVRMQRFIRDLNILESDTRREDEDVSVDDVWEQIRNNWNIVRDGIVGLATTVERAGKIITEAEKVVHEVGQVAGMLDIVDDQPFPEKLPQLMQTCRTRLLDSAKTYWEKKEELQ